MLSNRSAFGLWGAKRRTESIMEGLMTQELGRRGRRNRGHQPGNSSASSASCALNDTNSKSWEKAMLVERSELTVKPGAESEFHAAIIEKGVPLLQGVDGVLSVQVGRGVENPSKFMLLVGWQSMEAHTAYGGTPTSLEVRGIMGPFLTGGAMEHFEVQ
jgi:heme-degrading monooxygenase HmoA